MTQPAAPAGQQAPPQQELNLRVLLQEMIQRGASDLHITVGNPAKIRIDGDLTNSRVAQVLAPILGQLLVAVVVADLIADVPANEACEDPAGNQEHHSRDDEEPQLAIEIQHVDSDQAEEKREPQSQTGVDHSAGHPSQGEGEIVGKLRTWTGSRSAEASSPSATTSTVSFARGTTIVAAVPLASPRSVASVASNNDQAIGDLRKAVSPGTRQQQVPLGESGPPECVGRRRDLQHRGRLGDLSEINRGAAPWSAGAPTRADSMTPIAGDRV